jgi:hypothetical protein
MLQRLVVPCTVDSQRFFFLVSIRKIRTISERKKKKQGLAKIGTNQNPASRFSVGVFSARLAAAGRVVLPDLLGVAILL